MCSIGSYSCPQWVFQIISNQFLKLFVTPNVERGKRDTGQTRDTSRAKMKAEKNSGVRGKSQKVGR